MTLVVTDLAAPGVERLSLTVGTGEIVALAGHDTGRTRAVQAMAGLEQPRAGTIVLAGQEITGAAPERIAGLGLSYVPAGRRGFGGLSVDENLSLGADRIRRDEALVATRRAAARARQSPAPPACGRCRGRRARRSRRCRPFARGARRRAPRGR